MTEPTTVQSDVEGDDVSALQVALQITTRLLDNSYTLDETLRFVIAEIRSELRAEFVDIMFEYADGLRVEMSSDPVEDKRLVPLTRSISGLALSRGEPIVVNGISAGHELWERYLPRTPHQSSGAPTTLNGVAAPIKLDGSPIGVINVESAHRTFGPDDVGFVATIAAQVSLAVSHAALFDENHLRTENDALLVSDTAAGSDAVMRHALGTILTTLKTFGFIDADGVEILLPDPQNPSALIVAHSTNESAIGLRVGVDGSVCGRAFRERRTVLLPRAEDDDQYKPLQDGMKCEMAIPIQLGGNERFAIGVLNIECARENAFSRVSRLLAERFARRVVFILTLAKMRADRDDEFHDQMMVNAADQVLNAVHRINNHLGSARVLVRDLLTDLRSPQIDWDDTERRLQFLEEELTHSLAIPDEVRRRVVMSEESADVDERVRTALDRVRIPGNVTHVVDLHGNLPSVACTNLDLAVENLVGNALNALAETGGGHLRLSTALEQRPDAPAFVVVEVADTGAGMTDDQVATLFDRRPVSDRGRGLGFGMVWVRAWVRRANGLINVESAPGVGTTVTIRFQIDPPEETR